MLRRLAPLLILLGVVLAYARSLEVPFVWDDRHLVFNSARVTELHPILSYFTEPFWSNAEIAENRVYYRPLTILSLALDYKIHADNPAGFHLTNLALHLFNSLLLFGLLRRYGASQRSACALSLLWALFPRLTEAVAWVSGRTDVLATFFVLLALWSYRPRSLARVAISAGFILAGLLAKEVALAGALSLFALIWLTPRSTPPNPQFDALKQRLLASIPLVVALCCYLALRAQVLSQIQIDAQSVIPLSLAERAQAVASAVAYYSWMLVWGWFPHLQLGQLEQLDLRIALAGGGLLVLFGAALLRRARTWRSWPAQRRAGLLLGASLGAGSLGLVLHIIPISVDIIAADRFLYLPGIALCFLAIPCFNWLGHRNRTKLPFLTAMSALLISYACATFLRVNTWTSESALWLETYQRTPAENPRPGLELGNIYYRASLYEKAAALYENAAANSPRPESAQGNYANALSQLGRYDESSRILLKLCDKYTGKAKYCLDAGLAELAQHRFSQAEALFKEAKRRSPQYTAADDALALLPRVKELIQQEAATKSASKQRELQFQIASLSGQWLKARALGRIILQDRELTPEARRDALEFWVRFGPPNELESEFFQGKPAHELLNEETAAAILYRIDAARELEALWPSVKLHNARSTK